MGLSFPMPNKGEWVKEMSLSQRCVAERYQAYPGNYAGPEDWLLCAESPFCRGCANAQETAQLGFQLALLSEPAPIKGKRQGEQ